MASDKKKGDGMSVGMIILWIVGILVVGVVVVYGIFAAMGVSLFSGFWNLIQGKTTLSNGTVLPSGVTLTAPGPFDV